MTLESIADLERGLDTLRAAGLKRTRRTIETAHVYSPGLGWVVTHEDVTEEIASEEIVQKRKRELERQNIVNDTAVLLSSDHGFFLGEHHLYDKRLMYEPSIRVPMMVSCPRRRPSP